MRQWALSLPIPLRVLLAAQPELVTPVLQVVQQVITRHLLDDAQLPADAGHGGAVTLIQRFGSAADLNITFTASCWTARTGPAPTACRPSSRRVRPPTTSCTRCCRPSSPG